MESRELLPTVVAVKLPYTAYTVINSNDARQYMADRRKDFPGASDPSVQCRYPVEAKSLVPYCLVPLPTKMYGQVVTLHFPSPQAALKFFVTVQSSHDVDASVLLQPQAEASAKMSVSSRLSTDSQSPDQLDSKFAERSLLVNNVPPDVDAEKLRETIENRIQETSSPMLVESVLYPVDTSDLLIQEPNRKCAVITLSSQKDVRTLASWFESTKISAGPLHKQLIGDTIVKLDADSLKTLSQSKHLDEDMYKYLIRRFGVKLIPSEDNTTLECHGHWLQIQPMLHNLMTPVHPASMPPAQANPPQPSTANGHEDMDTDEPVPSSSKPDTARASSQPPAEPYTTSSHPSRGNPAVSSTVISTQADLPTVHKSRSDKSSGSSDTGAGARHCDVARAGMSPRRDAAARYGTSPDDSDAYSNKSKSSESAATGARPKSSSKSRKFKEAVKAPNILVDYILNVTYRHRAIEKKMKGEVWITRGDEGFEISANQDSKAVRAATLLQDEIKAISELIDVVDVPDGDFQVAIDHFYSRSKIKYPETLVEYDMPSQRVIICGEDVSCAVGDLSKFLHSSSVRNPVAPANPREVHKSEAFPVEKDILVYIQTVKQEDINAMCQRLSVKLEISDVEEFGMCIFIGLSSDSVQRASEKMKEFVEEASSSLSSENVLYSEAKHKQYHRQMEDIKQHYAKDVVFCFSESNSKLHLVGVPEKVTKVREQIEGLSGTRRKRGNSLSRRSRRPHDDGGSTSATSSSRDIEKEKYGHLTRSLGPNPSRSLSLPQPSVTPSSFCHTLSKVKIHVLQYDITKLHVDMIMNSASGDLMHGGGVSRAIAIAAGDELIRQCNRHVKKNGQLKVMESFISSAGRLPCKKVMHVVGPSIKHTRNRRQELQTVFHRCLISADQENMYSIAIPPISAGNLGCPLEEVSDICASVINGYFSLSTGSAIDTIYIVDVNQEPVKQIQEKLRVQANLKECPFCGEYPGNVKVNPLGSNAATTRPSSSIVTSSSRGSYASVVGSRPTTSSGYGPPPTTPHFLAPTDIRPGQITATAAFVKTVGTTSATDHKSSQPMKAIHPSSMGETRRSLSKTPSRDDDDEDTCTICMSAYTNPRTLPKCKHTFCTDCIDACFKKMKPACPVCGEIYGEITGNQPESGQMSERTEYTRHLPGYEGCGTIVIDYYFPSGKQGPDHPKQGAFYSGTTRVAYLPDNTEGRKVLTLLKRAFNARLTFTIGRSVTSGREDTVTWNDIHHKTSRTGGQQGFGYPDPTYLKRVQEELAAKGIK